MSQDGNGEQVKKIAELEDQVEKKKSFNFLLISAVFCFFAFLAVVAYLPLPSPAQDPLTIPWIVTLNKMFSVAAIVEGRVALGGGLFTYLIFSIGLQLFDRRDRTNEQASALFRAMVDNDSLIEKLSNESKRSLVEQSLKTILPTKIGGALYDDVISPLVDNEVPYRRKYEYTVRCLSSGDSPDEGAGTFPGLFKSKKYRWIRETIQYQPYFPEEDRVYAGSYDVVLVFDKGALDTLFKDHSIFYRAMVELEDAELKILTSKGNAEIKKFLIEDLQFSAKDGGENGTEVQNSAAILWEKVPSKEPGHAPHPYLRITLPASRQENIDFKLPRISLRLPHSRNATHFTFTLPQPCETPIFEFIPARDMERVSEIYYMSDVQEERLRLVPQYEGSRLVSSKIEVKSGWVFPTSGVTYTWDNKR